MLSISALRLCFIFDQSGNWTDTSNWWVKNAGNLVQATNYPIALDTAFFDLGGVSNVLYDANVLGPAVTLMTGNVTLRNGSPFESIRIGNSSLLTNITLKSLTASGNGTYNFVTDVFQVAGNFVIEKSCTLDVLAANLGIQSPTVCRDSAKPVFNLLNGASFKSFESGDTCIARISAPNADFGGNCLFGGSSNLALNVTNFACLTTTFTDDFTFTYVKIPSSLVFGDITFKGRSPLLLKSRTSILTNGVTRFEKPSIVTFDCDSYISFNGPVIINGTNSIISSGPFLIFGGRLDLLAPFEIKATAPIVLQSTIRFSGTSTISDEFLRSILFAGPFIFSESCIVTISQPLNVRANWIFEDAASLVVLSTLRFQSALNFSATGGMSGSGTVSIESSLVGRIPSHTNSIWNVVVSLSAPMIISSGKFAFGRGLLLNNTLIDMQGNSSLTLDGLISPINPRFIGSGTLILGPNANYTIPKSDVMNFAVTILNGGLLNIFGNVTLPEKYLQTNTGKLNLQNTTLFVANSAPLVLNGGILDASGMIATSLINKGLTRIPGLSTLRIMGDCEFPFGSTLIMQSNGRNTNENSQLRVDGNTKISSLLYVKFERFSTAVGDQIPLIYTQRRNPFFNVTTVLGGAPYKLGSLITSNELDGNLKIRFFLSNSSRSNQSVASFAVFFAAIVMLLMLNF